MSSYAILHTMMAKKYKSLLALVDSLQRSAKYTFARAEAESALNISGPALTKALQRLTRSGRLCSLRRGFYVIVPLEHADAGIIPADWFVDDLMKHLRLEYYVGVLSAAAIHGAAHQRPQEYQVVVSRSERSIHSSKLRIRFFKHTALSKVQTNRIRTYTGEIPVSTPEGTAIDLVRFNRRIGGLDAVMTILTELGEVIDPSALVLACKREKVRGHIQRLGWLLDRVGWEKLTCQLAEWLAKQKTSKIPLNGSVRSRKGKKDPRWNVIINDDPKSDI